MRIWTSAAIGAIVVVLATGQSTAEALPNAVAFSVDTTQDSVDVAPGDGACEDAAGQCSLRSAVMETNVLPGPDAITVPAGTYELTLLENPEGHLVVTDDLIIAGAGASATEIRAGNADPGVVTRVFEFPCADLEPQIQIEISGVTISNGQAQAGGGGGVRNCARDVHLHEVALIGNRGTNGGALYSEDFCPEFGCPSFPVRHQLVVIENSLFSGNTAVHGGAIFGFGHQNSLTNVTISGNTATGNVSAIRGYAALTNVSIVGNTDLFSEDEYPNWASQIDGEFQTKNSLLSAPAGTGNCQNFTSWHSLDAHNLLFEESGFTSCLAPEATDLVRVDPRLAPLGDNGGPTLTHALLPDSPAIDAANNDVCPATDQRGVTRPQGGGCDIGAYEYQTRAPTVSPTAAPEQAQALPPTGGEAGGGEQSLALVALGLTLLGGFVAGFWWRRSSRAP